MVEFCVWRHEKGKRKPPTKNRPKKIYESSLKQDAIDFATEDAESKIQTLKQDSVYVDTYSISKKSVSKDETVSFQNWFENKNITEVIYVKDVEGYILYEYFVVT